MLYAARYNMLHGVKDHYIIDQLSTQLKSDSDYWCFPPPHPDHRKLKLGV